MTREQFLGCLRQACDRAGGVAAWAQINELSATYVSEVLAGKHWVIGPAYALLKALGLRRKVLQRAE